MSAESSLRVLARQWYCLLFVALAVVLLGMWGVTRSNAAPLASTINVNSFDDELNNDGDCSLREAIQAANGNESEWVDMCPGGSSDPLAEDTIYLAPGTYTLSQAGDDDLGAVGDLDIAQNLRLEGLGQPGSVVISGGPTPNGGIDRLFHILTGTVTLQNLVVQHGYNQGAGGGALVEPGASLIISDSFFKSNLTGHVGGGVAALGGASLEVYDSVFYFNRAMNGGGGAIFSDGTLTAANSTLYGNIAYDYGGGITIGTTGTAYLTNLTLAENLGSIDGGGIYNMAAAGSATLRNTLLSGNNPQNCLADVENAITDSGGNLDSGGTCGFLEANGSISGVDPLLGSYSEYPGSLPTLALLPGSSAIAAADVTTCQALAGDPDYGANDQDQRGISRTAADAACDIGAYEVSTFTWTGAGGNNAWHNPANWDLGIVPGEGDHAFIDWLSSVDILSPVTVGSLHINGATVTQPSPLFVLGDFESSFSSYSSSAYLTIGGDFTLTDGSFTAPAVTVNPYPTMQVAGDFTCSSGSFFENTGVVELNGYEPQVLDCPNLFGNLEINNHTPAPSDSAAVTVPITSMVVVEALEIMEGQFMPNDGSMFGSVAIYADGILKPQPGAYLEVGSDFIATGAFIHNNSSVVFTGIFGYAAGRGPGLAARSPQSGFQEFFGEAVFYDLTVFPGNVLTLREASNLGVENNLTIEGSLDLASYPNTLSLLGANTWSLPSSYLSGLYVGPSASLDLSDEWLYMSGDLMVDGALVGSPVDITFDSMSAQLLSLAQPFTFDALTVETDTVLLDGSPGKAQAARLTNRGVIRGSLPVTVPGAYDFGLTGVQLDVQTKGSLSNVTIDRIDAGSTLPDPAGLNLSTGRHWVISPNPGANGTFAASLTLPQSGQALPQACRHTGAEWDCGLPENHTSDGRTVTRSGVSSLSAWTVSAGPNTALAFDGIDDYLDAGPTPELAFESMGAFTLEAWVRTLDATGGILAKAGDPASGAAGYSLAVDGGRAFFAVHSNETASLTSTTLINDGRWHHLAAVSDASAIMLYVDGFLESTDMAMGLSSPNTANLEIGRAILAAGGLPQYLSGEIDEVRIWSAPLYNWDIDQWRHREVNANHPYWGSLLAYYKLNGSGLDSTAVASIGADAPLVGFALTPTWVPSGAFGGSDQALDFDGVDDYVFTEGISTLDHSADLTVEAWIKPHDAFDGTVLYKNDAAAGFSLGLSEGKVVFTLLSGGMPYSLISDVPVDDGRWHHVAGLRQNGAAALYIDGALQTQTIPSVPGSLDNAGGLYIGSDDLLAFPYYGQIDEVRLWNVARSAAQIHTDLARTLTGDEPGLAAYFRFDQGRPSGDNSSFGELYNLASPADFGFLHNFTLTGPTSNFVTSSAFNTWVGSVSASWLEPLNWSRGIVPGILDTIGVPPQVGGYILDLGAGDPLIISGQQNAIQGGNIGGGTLSIGKNGKMKGGVGSGPEGLLPRTTLGGNIGGGTLSLRGNFINQGAFFPEDSTITFDGSGFQFLVLGVPTVFNNIVISTGVTLTVDSPSNYVSYTGSFTNTTATQTTLPVTGTGWLAFGLTGVSIYVDDPGSLASLTAQSVIGDHPNSVISNTQQGMYYVITRELLDGASTTAIIHAPSAEGLITITLPYAGSLTDVRLCRYTGDPGGGFSCGAAADHTVIPAVPGGMGLVVRRNVSTAGWDSGFDVWTIGENVGPTLIRVQSLSARPAVPAALPALAIGLTAALGIFLHKRRPKG